MLRELKEIGGYLREVEGRGGLEDYLDDLEGYDKIVSIDFKRSEKGSGFVYDGVSLMDIESENHNPKDVLYRQGATRGVDITPTSKITRIYSQGEYEKAQKDDEMTSNDTFSLKTKRWFKKNYCEEPFVKSVKEEFDRKGEEIRNELKKKYQQNIASNQKAVLTVRYEKGGGEMSFIGDFDFFRNKVEEKLLEKWRHKYGEDSKSEGKSCSLCHDKKAVLGFAFPFRFYTVDNARFAPDFERGDSWKNLPLCEECAFDLRIGSKFLESNSFSFYGDIEYYVIPDFPFEGPQEKFMKLMSTGKKGSEYSFLDAEKMYSHAERPEFPLNMDFVFFKKERSSHKIYKYVEDVSPSHVRKAEDTLKKAYDLHSQ